MPEDTDGEAPLRILERLDCAVVGPRDLAEALAETAVALVVVRFHRRVLTEQGADAARRLDPDVVVGELAGRVPMPLVAELVRQVLDEVASERDVEHLRAAAHGENRHVPLERRLQHVHLRLVPRVTGRVGLRMRVGAVQRRIDIRAAREDDAVEHRQRLLDRVLYRRDDERTPAGMVEGPDIAQRDKGRLLLPGAPANLLGVRGDADHRPHAASHHSSQRRRDVSTYARSLEWISIVAVPP